MSSNINTNPPSGSRDFLPTEKKLRDSVFSKIKKTFEKYGFVPLETPAFERIETLTGKYGSEGEKLIFKILKRGEQASTGEADMALRYDLTIPFVRVISNHQEKLPRIFKRYQIGPVWRADRPGRGRFREFYQCDIDIVGTSSLSADGEILLVLTKALSDVGLSQFEVRLNSRKVLLGLLESYHIPKNLHKNTLIILDKLDKMNVEKIESELKSQGIPEKDVKELISDIEKASIEKIRERLGKLETGKKGLQEVDELIELVTPLLKEGKISFTPFLARGLDYYTGPIFEIYAEGLPSSIASGGRYDDLIGLFSKKSRPVCGGSLGIERILLLLEEKNKGQPLLPSSQVLITIWDASFRQESFSMAEELRSHGVPTEVYLGDDPLKKQLGFASDQHIPFCIVYGPDEKKENKIAVKDLKSREQKKISKSDLINFFKKSGGSL